MASTPEHVPNPDDKIRWLGRDHAPAEPPALAPSPDAPRADEPPRSSRLAALRRRWPLIAIIALVLIVAAVLTARSLTGGAPAVPAQGPALPLVSVVTPRLSTVTSTVSLTGTISARYDIAMGAEGEGGRVAAVHVEEGDHVTRGQILATLDTSVLRPQVTRLAASLVETRANAELREAEYRRARVRLVGPVIDPNTRLGWLRVELDPDQARGTPWAATTSSVSDSSSER